VCLVLWYRQTDKMDSAFSPLNNTIYTHQVGTKKSTHQVGTTKSKLDEQRKALLPLLVLHQ